MTTTTGPADPSSLPADARTWLDRLAAGEPTPWDEADVEWLADGELPRNLDHSYLTEASLANADTAANVRAIDDTAALVTWVAQTDDKALGYWRGPSGTPAAEAPLVEYDTEGQFYLAGATSITEFLVQDLVELDHDRDELVATCRAAGITAELRDIEEWENPDVDVEPRHFHVGRYRDHLGQGPDA